MAVALDKAKWFLPVIIVLAMVAAVALVWGSTGGSSDEAWGGGGGGSLQLTDANPAYDDELVAPPEVEVPQVLYTIVMDPDTSVIPMGGGDLVTVSITNNIEEPINNGSYGITMDLATMTMIPVNATRHGDIEGDLVITADVYNIIFMDGCIYTYGSNNTTQDGEASANVVLKILRNIVVHPGMTVNFLVPVVPGLAAVAGAELLLKAEFYIPGTFTTYGTGTPWMPGDSTGLTPPATWGP
jgi:hypothetical protein